MQTDLYRNIPDNVQIDDDLYQPEFTAPPLITWHGRSGTGNEAGGYWTLKAESLDGQEPGPKGFWELVDMRYGTDPNNPMESVWKAQRLRCVPIAIRKRQVITDELKQEHYFPWMTRKTDRGGVIGKYSTWYQVLVQLPDVDKSVVVALRGYTKSLAWENNPSGKFGKTDFPRGVENQLIDISSKASKAKNTKIPWLCFWAIDLVPAYQSDKPYWIDVGHGTYMNPFTLDMTVSDKPEEGYPSGRFVGADEFIRLQNIRRETGMDWEAQWATVAQGGDTAYDYADEEAATPPIEDEIPF